MTLNETKEWDAYKDGHEEVWNLVGNSLELCELYARIGHPVHCQSEAQKCIAKLEGFGEGWLKDVTAFADALSEIEKRFEIERACTPGREEEILWVIECLSECRKKWEEDKRLVPDLRGLKQQILRYWLPLAYDESLDGLALRKKAGLKESAPSLRDEKGQLDDLLWNFVYIRHEYKPEDSYFKEGYLEQAKKYLNTAWMHSPWITQHLLNNLFDAELAPFRKTESWPNRHPWALLALFAIPALAFRLSSFFWLALIFPASGSWHYVKALRKLRLLDPICREIKSGNYDDREIARRLQRLEEKGHYVPTLIYPLLRLAASSGTAPG